MEDPDPLCAVILAMATTSVNKRGVPISKWRGISPVSGLQSPVHPTGTGHSWELLPDRAMGKLGSVPFALPSFILLILQHFSQLESPVSAQHLVFCAVIGDFRYVDNQLISPAV